MTFRCPECGREQSLDHDREEAFQALLTDRLGFGGFTVETRAWCGHHPERVEMLLLAPREA